MQIMQRKEAQQKGLRTYFNGKACVRGHIAERLSSNATCVECLPSIRAIWKKGNPKVAAINRAYYKNNKEKISAINKRWRDNNPEKLNTIRENYYQNNKDAICNQARARKSRVKIATPKWADKKAISALYRQARRLTAETGIPHDVDHIIPLNGCCVSGLHIAINLQVMTHAENRSKGRQWTCQCGTSHDRDVNAAKNIARLGCETLAVGDHYA